MRTLYKNLDIYTDKSHIKGDILVNGDTIERIAENIDVPADTVYDCKGLAALPGLCDIHVHFRDPGLTHKEDIITGCASAAAGGVTAVCCMPNTSPVCDNVEVAKYMVDKAEGTGIKVFPIGSVTVNMEGKELCDYKSYHDFGITMISDDGKPVANAEVMRRAMEEAKKNDIFIASHCEDLDIVNGGIMNKGEVSESLGVKGIDRASEDSIVAREIALADSLDAHIHICHLSTSGSLDEVRAAKKRGVNVTCETAPHYFMCNDTLLMSRDADYRMNPPLRTEKDRLAIIDGVRDGTIDCIITDHAPHTAEEKAIFEKAPNGVVGLETSFAATITCFYHSGMLGIEDIVRLMSVRPRELAKIPPVHLEEGAKAEFIIADTDLEWYVEPERLHSRSKNSIFKGRVLKGKVMLTVTDGRIIYMDERFDRAEKKPVDRLIAKIREMNNPTVAGLDPRLEYIPQYILDKAVEKHGKTLKAAGWAIYRFNKELIDALYDIVPAVKPQAAYYEMYGHYGVKALEKTIEYAKKRGMFVIVDGKRNDIGATMTAYASAYLGTTDVFGEIQQAFGADALTVNGYLGTDGIKPALETGGMIFALVKTSNKSSGELQDRRLCDGKTVYETMGDMCEKWGSAYMGENGYSQVGAVVGATYPEQLKELRAKLPHTFFLIPGYGAQGGGAEGAAMGFDENGSGAIVNSSRAIMCAYKKEECDEHDFALAARREALRMKDDLNNALGK